jgi:hypothetical protein
MADLGSRIQRAVAELTGNEALLGMLETDAATEMLDWGVKMSTSIVNETEGLDDFLADASLLPRLKAVRSSLRSIGNWAVGEYVKPEDRMDLRDKLLDRFKTIFGESVQLPTSEALDDLLHQVDNATNTPHQLVLKMIQLFTAQNQGDNN